MCSSKPGPVHSNQLSNPSPNHNDEFVWEVQRRISPHHPSFPRVFDVCKHLNQCGKTQHRVVRGENRYYPNFRCKHPLCPRCNRWVKRQIAEKSAKQLSQITGLNPNLDHVSYVTINGPKLQLGSDFSAALKWMKQRIRYRVDTKLNLKFKGEFEIAVQYDETTGAPIGQLYT